MRGEPTPESTIAEFRAHYLYSGNVSASARAVDIPIRTGHDIARKLRADSSFTKARQELRARALGDLVAMRMQIAEEAFNRFSGTDDIEYPERGDGNVTIIDKRGEYGRLVIDCEKNAHSLAKVELAADMSESEKSGPAVVINLSTKETVEPSSDVEG